MRLHANLAHGGASPYTTTPPPETHQADNKPNSESDPQEPHEGSRSLHLSAALLIVCAAVCDPVGGLALGVVAVNNLELRSQDNTSNEGEERRSSVEAEINDRVRKTDDKEADDAVNCCEP